MGTGVPSLAGVPALPASFIAASSSITPLSIAGLARGLTFAIWERRRRLSVSNRLRIIEEKVLNLIHWAMDVSYAFRRIQIFKQKALR